MIDNKLILDIQNGNRDLIPELWQKVRRWSDKLAYEFYIKTKEFCDSQCYDAEDLTQCGYFALLKAIKSYDASNGNYGFLSWYTFYVSKQFREEIHLRSGEGYKNNKANFDLSVRSLNDKISLEDESKELIESIPDEHDYYSEVDNKDEAEKLHKVLDDYIDDVLSDVEASVIRKKYWNYKTEKQIAKELNLTEKTTYYKVNQGLRLLRKNAYYDKKGNRMSAKRLMNYLEYTDSFIHKSRAELIRNHTSIPEHIVITKESYGML